MVIIRSLVTEAEFVIHNPGLSRFIVPIPIALGLSELIILFSGIPVFAGFPAEIHMGGNNREPNPYRSR